MTMTSRLAAFPAGTVPSDPRPAASERMHIVVTGHVDHGKSTVVGRLLADTGSLPDDKLAAVQASCERHAKPFEYAFLLDALRDERAQGITIDSARVFFATTRRQYAIVDAPGHVEFLRNMLTGASRADAALLVIGADEGIRENSRRHGFLLSMLAISQVAVIVNKMDLVGYSQRVFDSIVDEYRRFLDGFGLSPTRFIPVSARHGDNVASAGSRIEWYRGPTVLEALDAFTTCAPPAAASFRMPVQGVYKFTEGHDERRIVAGTIESGHVSVGDEIAFYPSGKTSRVASIEGFNRPPQSEALAAEATGFTLRDQIYVARGEIAVRPVEPRPHVGTRMRVTLFWVGKTPLTIGKQCVLRIGTGRAPFQVERIDRVLDTDRLTEASGRTHVERHEVAECTLALATSLAFDTVDRCPATGRFAIVDGYEISGGGLIREALPDGDAARPIAPAVLWFTGLSGAGKSTIAREVCARLRDAGVSVEYLDGDEIRSAFPQTGYTKDERDAHVRRVGFLASRLEYHGVFVVCALISPYAEARAHVRGLCRRFVEVHVSTPLDECERRDVKGLYRRARCGEIPHFTGIDDPYEPPDTPELRIDTTRVSVAEAADAVLAALRPAASGWRVETA